MNDKPELTTVDKVINISAIYYPYLDDLLELCNQVMIQCLITDVSYTHNNLTGLISFIWKNGTLNFLSFDKYFFKQLGLGTQEVAIFSKPLYYAPSLEMVTSMECHCLLYVRIVLVDDGRHRHFGNEIPFQIALERQLEQFGGLLRLTFDMMKP